MKIGELARRSRLSAHTIRYYERIGLLPPPDKDGSGHRNYDRTILDWIEFLNRLKVTGMSIREMREYADLRQLGTGTVAARQAILVRHRDRVKTQVVELQNSLSILDTKIESYSKQAGRASRHDFTQ